jgi:hypothetical protein
MKIKAVFVAIVTAFAGAACDSIDPTDITMRKLDGPLFSAGSGFLEVPPTNTGGGAVPKRIVGTIQPKRWAIVRISGNVNLSTNPENYSCNPTYKAPLNGYYYGPLGQANSNYLRVYPSRVGAGLQIFLDGDSSRVKTNVIYNPFTYVDTIKVSRNGISLNGCNGYGAYSMNGGQTVTVIDLPDPNVEALASMVNVGDSVTFTVSNAPSGLNIAWSAYLIGDTLETPKGYYGYNLITACNGQASCRIKVTGSGRMYAKFGNTVGGAVHYPSPIVWVGKPTPPTTLTLTCTPTTVPAGASPDCIAGTSPSDEPIQVVGWIAVNARDGQMNQICIGMGVNCSPDIEESVTIYVRAIVGGREQIRSAAIIVDQPRLKLIRTPVDAIVPPNTVITFSAIAQGSTANVQTTAWIYNRADGKGQMATCFAPTNPCTRTIALSGDMQVWGLVNNAPPPQGDGSPVTVGTKCTPSSPECPNLLDKVDSLKEHSNETCRQMGRQLQTFLDEGGIWRVPDGTWFEGVQYFTPHGNAISIKEKYFTTNLAELQWILAHEAAHVQYEHEDDTPIGELSVDDIDELCKE